MHHQWCNTWNKCRVQRVYWTLEQDTDKDFHWAKALHCDRGQRVCTQWKFIEELPKAIHQNMRPFRGSKTHATVKDLPNKTTFVSNFQNGSRSWEGAHNGLRQGKGYNNSRSQTTEVMFLNTEGTSTAPTFRTSGTPSTAHAIIRQYADTTLGASFTDFATIAPSADNFDNCRLLLSRFYCTFKFMLVNNMRKNHHYQRLEHQYDNSLANDRILPGEL